MKSIKLQRLNNKYLYYLRNEDNDYATNLLAEIMSINKRTEIIDEVSTVVKDLVLKFDDFYVYLPVTIIKFLDLQLSTIDYQFDMSELDIPPLPFKDIPEEELNKLGEFYGEFNEKLSDAIQEVSKYRNGIINLPTGWGKSWMILGLARLFLSNHSGNVMIIAPGSSLVDELWERFRFMKLDKYSGRINIENTKSLHANRFNEEQSIEWCKDVKLVLVDECESIPSTMEDFLINKLTNYSYIFGFSASPDKYHGRSLTESTNFHDINYNNWKIIEYLGHSFLHRSPEKLIQLKVIYGSFYDKPYHKYKKGLHYIQSITNVISSPQFSRMLKYISDHAIDSVYIPINSTKRINKILEKITVPYIYWDANTVYSTGEEKITNRAELRDYFKKVPRYNRPNIVFSTSTSYRGISIPELTDIVFVENSMYGNVIQTIGRTFRSECPVVWLPQESVYGTNPIYQICTWKRRKLIRETYKLLSYEDIKDWD